MIKRGQVTIFLIIGIVVLAAFFGILFIVKTITTQNLEVVEEKTKPAEVGQVKLFVESCLAKTAEDAVYYNFINAGFYQPNFRIKYQEWNVPYYFYLGEDLHPEKEEIEFGLAKYIQNNLPNCLGDLNNFPGMEIVQEKPLAIVTILEKKVVVNLKLPITIQIAEQVKEMNDFQTQLIIPLSEAVAILSERMKVQKTQPNEVLLTNLIDDSVEKNYKFKLFYQQDNVFYVLTFNKIIVKNKPLQVQFAVKYDWFPDLNKEVDLKPIGKLTAYINESFSYQLNATGENVTFNSSSKMFKSDPNGSLSIKFEDKDFGNYTLIWSAQNLDDSDSELMIINVLKKNDLK